MQTPYYLFEKNKIIENYQMVLNSLCVSDVYYALKANAEPLVLKVLDKIGAKFETSSIGEITKLIELGVDANRIIFGLPIKTEEIIRKAYKLGCRYFVFDHINEYNKIHIATYSVTNVTMVMRIFVSDICPESIEYGVKQKEIKSILEHNTIDGLSFHISNNTDIDSMLRVLSRVEEILDCIKPQNSSFILNIGGGFHLPFDEEYTKRLNQRLIYMKDKYGIRIICEPGQAVIKTAGVLITRVVAVRKQDGYHDIYLDAGYPTGVNRIPEYIKLYGCKVTPVDRKIRIYRFFDNTCMHQELFTKALRFDLCENDLLELGGFGSYSICKSNHFHCWDTPSVYLDKDDH
ncbi:hypothetical protein [Anaerocolumna sp. MB42-C2]|uniref:hypothetical protein n=1 Tax=Anaerocolumna sp. MB42-C2 TaxID=3070997 RepID=UPI0027DFC383|nr:hypothetical protein [Anaerocolumna sp. MB42-C2]WMJ86450.1 hypothetical protein RBU59_20780 [Anaerocolumna sp. MB42-C2]